MDIRGETQSEPRDGGSLDGEEKSFTLGILEAGTNRADLIADHGT